MSRFATILALLSLITGTIGFPLNPADGDPAVIKADIVRIDPPVHKPGTPVQITVDVMNPGAQREDVTFNLSVQASVPFSRPAMAEWLSHSGPQPATQALHTQKGQLGANTTTTVTMTIPPEAIRWGNTIESWGPRGIQLDIVDDSEVVASDRSILVTAPSFELEPMDVTTIVPLTTQIEDMRDLPSAADQFSNLVAATQSNEPRPTPALNKVAQRAAQRTQDQLAALTAPGISVGLDSVLSSRDYGTASTLLKTIRTFSNEAEHDLFLIPSFDPDFSAWTTASADSLYTPHVQTMKETQSILRSYGIASRTDVFLAAGPLAKNVAQRAVDNGMPLLVTDSRTVSPENNLYWTPAPHTEVHLDKPTDALIADDTMSLLLTGSLPTPNDTTETGLEPLDARQMLLASSAIHYRERPNDPRPLVLSIPRATLSTQQVPLARVNEMVELLDSTPWLRGTTLSTIAKTPVDTTALPEECSSTYPAFRGGRRPCHNGGHWMGGSGAAATRGGTASETIGHCASAPVRNARPSAGNP